MECCNTIGLHLGIADKKSSAYDLAKSLPSEDGIVKEGRCATGEL